MIKKLEILTNFACAEPRKGFWFHSWIEISLHIFHENHFWNFASVKTTR